MIPIPGGARIWMATGHTDMRRRMHGLALQIQQGLHRDPHAGDLYIFRGRRGDLVKILWHDGVGRRCTPNGSTAAGSSGLRRWMAWWPSRRRRWRACWRR